MSATSGTARTSNRDAILYANRVALDEAKRQGIAVPGNRLDPDNPAHAGLVALWKSTYTAYIANGGVPPSAGAGNAGGSSFSFTTLSAGAADNPNPPNTSGGGATISPSTAVDLLPTSTLKLPSTTGTTVSPPPPPPVSPPPPPSPPADAQVYDQEVGKVQTDCEILRRELTALIDRAKGGNCTGDDTLAGDIAGRLADFKAYKDKTGVDLFEQLPVRYRIAAKAVAAKDSDNGSGPEEYDMDYNASLLSALKAYAAAMGAGEDAAAVKTKTIAPLLASFDKASAELTYDRIQARAAEAGLPAVGKLATAKDASVFLGFRKQCKEFVDSIANGNGGSAVTYGAFSPDDYLAPDNAAVGKALYKMKQNKQGKWYGAHAMIITGVTRDPTTNAVTAVTVAESNYSSAFTYFYGGSIPGQVPWQRKVTSRTIPAKDFGGLFTADIDRSPLYGVKDFWLKSKISAGAGADNFDGQFKVTNGGPCPMALESLALQVVDAKGAVVLDRVQTASTLAAGATARMEVPSTRGTIAKAGTYTAIAKAKVGGVWRTVQSQTFTVGP